MTNRISTESRWRAFDGRRILTAFCAFVALISQLPWIGFHARVLADAPAAASGSNSESTQTVDQTVGDPAAPGAPDLSRLDAFHAVQEANKKLLSGDADRALKLYDVAAKQQPDAREVALGRGLGHYAKQEFDLAKDEFLKAAAGKNDGLGADAAYAAAACDHAAALGAQGDPKGAVSKLENAMRGYRDVLSTHPEHPSARDADRKAAMTWRNLKQQMQQQQQKQEQDKNQSEKQDDQEQKDQDKSQDSQKASEKKEDQQKQQSKQNQDSEQNQNQQQQASSEQQQDQKDAAARNDEEKQDQKDADAKQDSDLSKDPQESREAKAMKEQKEEASREQAERKLREMMQAVRQRRKDHRETQQPVQVMPVDKDW